MSRVYMRLFFCSGVTCLLGLKTACRIEYNSRDNFNEFTHFDVNRHIFSNFSKSKNANEIEILTIVYVNKCLLSEVTCMQKLG